MAKVDCSNKTCFVIQGIDFRKSQKQARKNRVSLCCSLFLSNSKGILYKALQWVNECSVKCNKWPKNCLYFTNSDYTFANTNVFITNIF